MTAPAVDFLAAQLAKLQDYETRALVDEYSTSALSRQRFVEATGYSSITDHTLYGTRKIILVVNDLLITASRQMPVDPETLSGFAHAEWDVLGKRPPTFITRERPFTPAQRRFLVASGFLIYTGKEARRNV